MPTLGSLFILDPVVRTEHGQLFLTFLSTSPSQQVNRFGEQFNGSPGPFLLSTGPGFVHLLTAVRLKNVVPNQ